MMVSIEIVYTDGAKNTNDIVDIEVEERELTNFLNLLSRNHARLYTVECRDHVIVAFGKDTQKVTVKIYN